MLSNGRHRRSNRKLHNVIEHALISHSYGHGEIRINSDGCNSSNMAAIAWSTRYCIAYLYTECKRAQYIFPIR